MGPMHHGHHLLMVREGRVPTMELAAGLGSGTQQALSLDIWFELRYTTLASPFVIDTCGRLS
jgi:hypothetical protein